MDAAPLEPSEPRTAHRITASAKSTYTLADEEAGNSVVNENCARPGHATCAPGKPGEIMAPGEYRHRPALSRLTCTTLIMSGARCNCQEWIPQSTYVSWSHAPKLPGLLYRSDLRQPDSMGLPRMKPLCIRSQADRVSRPVPCWFPAR